MAALADGNMGRVYRAERVGIARPVAIKFLHPGVATDPHFLKRFEVEARAMGRLAHPHCVSVLDFGTEVLPYIVMDLVEGLSLRGLLGREGRLTPPRALRIAGQMLSGLAHAHGHSIIHRDVKPENVMLAYGPGFDEHVRLVDFGLAKLVDRASQLTVGLAVGTPSYMAPESLTEGGVDERVDVYATGLVLFEMLTGTRAFEHPDMGEVLRRQRDEPPPSLASVSDGARAFSPALEAAVRRALQKRPEDRFPTAAAMQEALHAVPEAAGKPAAHASWVSRASAAVASMASGVPPSRPLGQPSAPSADEADSSLSAVKTRPHAPVAPDAPLDDPPASLPEPESRALSQRARAMLQAARSRNLPIAPAGRSFAQTTPGGRNRRLLAASVVVVTVSLVAYAWWRKVPTPQAPAPTAADHALQRPTSRADRSPATGGAPSPGGASAGSHESSPLAGEGEWQTPLQEIAEIDALANSGRRKAALARLRELRRSAPREPRYATAQARLSFEDHRWEEGLAAFKNAVRLDPTRRSDPALITGLIDSLQSADVTYQAEEFLKDLGAPAKALVRQAAREHRSAKVRQRCGVMLKEWTRRPWFRW